MNEEQGVQIDFSGLLRRRGPVMVVAALGVFLAAYWVAMALPNQYESYATLLVEPQAVDEALVASGVEASNLNERLHLMAAEILSRPRLSRVITELDLYSDQAESRTREEIISLMRDHVRVEPVLPELEEGLNDRRREPVEINTFRIYFHSHDAATAARVAQRLANDFIEEHIDERIETSQRSLDFMETEQERIANRLETVQARVAEVKDANAGRLPEELGANHRLHARTIEELRQAQRRLDEARSDAAFWKSQVLSAGAMGDDDGGPNPAQRLEMLELLIAELRAKGFTDKHPDVVKTRAEIQEVRARVERMSEEAEADTGQLTYAQQNARAEQRRAELRVAALSEEINRLQGQVEAIDERIAATPRVAERLDALQGTEAQLQNSLADFTNRLEEATVQANMERRQLGESFRILESAFVPPGPSSPNRIVILIIGLMLGIAAAGATGIVLEGVDSSAHSARQLQSYFSIPVLVSIPSIELEADRVSRRRSWLRRAALGAAAVVFCLVGGAGSYVVVNGAPGWLGDGGAAQTTPPTPGAGVEG